MTLLLERQGTESPEGDLLVKLDETKFLGDLNAAQQQLKSLDQSLASIRRRKIDP